MFEDQQGAFERLVLLGELSRDSKQVKGYDYETDLKVALRKRAVSYTHLTLPTKA